MNEDDQPSKTQLKKQMTDLQDLGAELVGLSAERLDSLALPENLLDAVRAAQRISKFGARRRQLQYIGKLMRGVDAGPIRARLDAWRSVSREHAVELHRIERWRARLLAEEGALAEFISAHPRADAQQLRALLRNALREREAGRPPKSFRMLFQFLRDAMQPQHPAEQDEQPR